MLTGFFIEKIKRKLGIKQLKTSDDVIQYLSDYDWPGNVRELEHLLSRAALKASSKQKDKKMVTIRLNDCDLLSNTLLSEDVYSNGEDIKHQNLPKKDLMNLRQEVDEFQKKLISMVLKEENGNWSLASKRLGTDRANLNRLAKRLGIQMTKFIT